MRHKKSHQIIFLGTTKMGALMQLVAYGAQDTYLTGQPSVTFFQAVYNQSTNFAMEDIQQTVNGSPGNNNLITVIVQRNGDLLGQMQLALAPKIGLPSNSLTSDNVNPDLNWIAERALYSVTFNIGGQQIDKHYQTWWRLYSELFLDESSKLQYNKMTSSVAASNGLGGNSSVTPFRVYLPLLFFFNRNPGLFLPLVALQYHEVRIDFNLSQNFTSYFDTSVFEVWANYVYLDSAERAAFVSGTAESGSFANVQNVGPNPNGMSREMANPGTSYGSQYLIDQLQISSNLIPSVGETVGNTVRINFNHPVKELIWCYQNSNPYTNVNAMWNFTRNPANTQVTLDPGLILGSNTLMLPQQLGSPHVFCGSNVFVTSFSTGGPSAAGALATYGAWSEEGAAVAKSEVGPLHQFKLQLNNQDRFNIQYGRYFNQVQPYYYHTGCPYPGIYVYSFALEPEQFQPTGSCNFSRIDTAQTVTYLKAGSLSTNQIVFATNYNILNISGGMGGLAFSN
jgi:Large eukaryotic DNA virus major capsid protein/Major capsid protein N-terminus